MYPSELGTYVYIYPLKITCIYMTPFAITQHFRIYKMSFFECYLYLLEAKPLRIDTFSQKFHITPIPGQNVLSSIFTKSVAPHPKK